MRQRPADCGTFLSRHANPVSSLILAHIFCGAQHGRIMGQDVFNRRSICPHFLAVSSEHVFFELGLIEKKGSENKIRQNIDRAGECRNH